MKILPSHRLGSVAFGFGAVLLFYLVLSYWGRIGNGNFDSLGKPSGPAADAVQVEPGAAYFFTWGVTASPRLKEIARASVESRYGDTYQQAYSALSQLTQDLAEVGLALRDVRAYIVADPEPDFAAWEKAFSEFFGTFANPNRPALTTVGIARLFHSDYRVEVEFTAVFPDGRGPHEAGSRHHERYARLSRVETSDRWKSFGRPAWPMSTGKATVEDTGYFFSSSVRPQSLLPNSPPGFYMFGTIAQQSASLFKQMGEQLKEAGLGFEDVFFMRACVYPGSDSISKSFATFNQEYSKFFNNDRNPNRPTRTVMSIPGFNYRNQSISIEYYAAYPADSEMTISPPKVSIGDSPAFTGTGSLGPAGAAVPPQSSLVFLSGSLSQKSGDIESEARSALQTLEAKLELADASLAHLVQLRAYLKTADPNTLDARLATWERIYRETFASDAAPALTLLPVVALPLDRLIALEATAAVSTAGD